MRARLTDPEQIARRQTIDGYHTHSEELGALAARAEAKQLVLSHILFRGGTPADLRADIEPSFARPVTVGEDLMTFDAG
jgi:ribonuclease Z